MKIDSEEPEIGDTNYRVGKEYIPVRHIFYSISCEKISSEKKMSWMNERIAVKNLTLAELNSNMITYF